MKLADRTRALALGSVAMLAVAVLGTRPFVDSWTRALIVGLPVFGAMQLFAFWDRRRARRAMERRYGRLMVRGPVLSVEEPSGGVTSVHAADMHELWYEYSPFGWSGANDWKLVYEVEQGRKALSIHEVGDGQFLESLRAWCARHLPGFDPAAFDRVASSLGDDGEPDVLVWARQDR